MVKANTEMLFEFNQSDYMKLLTINSKSPVLDVSNISKGVYFVEVSTAAGSANEKTIINKKIVVQ